MITGIDTSFFYGPLKIAQLTEVGVQKDVQQYIELYEPELLTKLLGGVVYQEFKTAADNSPEYIRLKSGATYMTGIGAERWDGLITGKRSPIANYIYCRYMADHASDTTAGGEKIVKSENATDVTPEYKIARAWNEMADMNKNLYRFLTYDPYFKSFLLPYSNIKRYFSPINVLF